MGEKKNVAIICISKKALLTWLQFEGGIIHNVRENLEQWNPDQIELVIEHPDLDEVEDGYTLRHIFPAYVVEGRQLVRINPPKKETGG